MKKTQEILGLPIISISDGMEVGRVKGIIVNAQKGAIDYLVVDSGIQIFSPRVIPTDRILGIGEYAVTIENEGEIADISKIPAAIDLLQKNIQVKATKVLTKKGRLIGETGDVYVDENESCRITGLEFIADITQKKVRIMPRESVITFGKDLMVVSDDVESRMMDRPSQLGPDDSSGDSEKKNLNFFNSTPKSNTLSAEFELKQVKEEAESENIQKAEAEGEAALGGSTFPDSVGAFSEILQENSESAAQTSAASLFEQKQKQYLLGRRASKTITDNQGNVLVAEGMPIDEGIISAAKESGKLVELVMNNQA